MSAPYWAHQTTTPILLAKKFPNSSNEVSRFSERKILVRPPLNACLPYAYWTVKQKSKEEVLPLVTRFVTPGVWVFSDRLSASRTQLTSLGYKHIRMNHSRKRNSCIPFLQKKNSGVFQVRWDCNRSASFSALLFFNRSKRREALVFGGCSEVNW